MAEHKDETIATEQPPIAEPTPPALAAPPAGGPHFVRSLGLVILGALLAVGTMMVLSKRQASDSASQIVTRSGLETQPAVPAVSNTAAPTVRLNGPQMQHIALATISLKRFQEEKMATGKIAFN